MALFQICSEKPTLAGVAKLVKVLTAGETTPFSNAGNIKVSSDFLSARLEGDNTILLDDWPQAPMQLRGALVNPQAITIRQLQ